LPLTVKEPSTALTRLPFGGLATPAWYSRWE
jgi:hypothetical protein